MNGIVAKPTLPPLPRLLRAGLTLCCCVLSASLIGAVHTRTWNAAPAAASRATASVRAPVKTVPAHQIEADDHDHDAAQDAADVEPEVELATFQVPPTQRMLEQTASVPAARLAPAAPPAPASPATRVVWMEVTAYCPCKKCCGPRAQGLTASGRHVSYNGGRFVAADRAVPFNTKLLIPGYAAGQAVPVLDRGGAIKGKKLDVYFPSHEQARQWGRRFIPVTVLN